MTKPTAVSDDGSAAPVAPRALLGHAGRGWKLRYRDVVRVPSPPGGSGRGGHGAAPAFRGAGRSSFLPGLHRRGAGRVDRICGTSRTSSSSCRCGPRRRSRTGTSDGQRASTARWSPSSAGACMSTPQRRRKRPRARGVRRELRPSRRGQEPVRPRQLLPPEPQRGSRRRCLRVSSVAPASSGQAPESAAGAHGAHQRSDVHPMRCSGRGRIVGVSPRPRVGALSFCRSTTA